MNLWLVIFGMAAVTYSVRLLPLTLLKEEHLAPWIRRGLNYVPIAVLSAIIAPSFLPHETWLDFVIDAHLPAGIAAVLVAGWTRNVFATISVGMLLLIALS